MKKKVIIILICIIAFITVIFIYNKNNKLSIDNMSLREKIGQMLMVYYNIDEVDEDLIKSLEENKPGGFILTGANLVNYNRTKKFISDLYKYGGKNMIVAVDQEGGSVQRLYDIKDKKATFLPNMYDVGILDDKEISYRIGNIIGTEVSSIGANTVFSPVLDIGDYKTSAMGKRMISNDKDIVISNAMEIYKGIYDTDVIPIVKHFPGIGDTSLDTHDANVSIVDKTYEELYDTDLQPFINAIDKGVEVIMVGHSSYPKIINDNLPASLSSQIITGILRDKLKFDGVVIMDAVNMGTISNNYSEKDIYIKAINAGVNMFIMPNGSKRVIDLIENAVKSGEIDEKMIDDSAKRIVDLRNKISNKNKFNNNFGLSINKKFICEKFHDYCIYNE